jgi:hypothetical protein
VAQQRIARIRRAEKATFGERQAFFPMVVNLLFAGLVVV